MDAATLFFNQVSFYGGDKTKAWNSLNNASKIKIPHLKPIKKRRNSDKSKYRAECWRITEKNKHALKNINLRSFKSYDIDHIVPISYGFKKGILPYLIGSSANLRILPNAENLKKGTKITSEAIIILSKWGIAE